MTGIFESELLRRNCSIVGRVRLERGGKWILFVEKGNRHGMALAMDLEPVLVRSKVR